MLKGHLFKRSLAAFAASIAVAGTLVATSPAASATVKAQAPAATAAADLPIPTPPAVDLKRDNPTPVTPRSTDKIGKKGRHNPAPPTPCTSPCFMYAGAKWSNASNIKDGAGFTIQVQNPALASTDYHSLGEIAVQSADGKQIVEFGINRDVAVNGDSNPHIFVYHWVNGATSCYNACGWVDYGPETTFFAGKNVASYVGTTFQISVQYSGGAWWIGGYFDGSGVFHWLGYFPGSLWTSPTFTQSGLVQWFGEVASANKPTCTDMGNGQLATTTVGATMSGTKTLQSGTWSSTAYTGSYQDTVNGYAFASTSTTSFRYGGGGSPQAVGC